MGFAIIMSVVIRLKVRWQAIPSPLFSKRHKKKFSSLDGQVTNRVRHVNMEFMGPDVQCQ